MAVCGIVTAFAAPQNLQFVLFESLDSTAITYGLRGQGGLSDGESIDENGGGPGVRLRNRQRPKADFLHHGGGGLCGITSGYWA